MSPAGLAMGLGIMALLVITVLVAVLVRAEREPLDDPTENGDGEP